MLATELKLQIASFFGYDLWLGIDMVCVLSQQVKGSTAIDWGFMKEKKTVNKYE